jgi:putative FmdB family regulatory protein
MPTYVYRCQQCNNHLEVIQKFSDAPLKICPRCQGQLNRVIHATGIVFKGSGWYVTDSRSSSPTSKPAPKGADKPDTAKTEASADAPAVGEAAKAEPTRAESTSAGTPASTSSD